MLKLVGEAEAIAASSNNCCEDDGSPWSNKIVGTSFQLTR